MVRRLRKRAAVDSDSDLSWVPPSPLTPDSRNHPILDADSGSEDEIVIVDDTSRVTRQRTNQGPVETADSVVGHLVLIGAGAIVALSLIGVGVYVVGILNPIIQTLKSMEKRNREYERRWAVYWVVLATLFLFQWIPRMVLGWIPGYSVVLISFLWWLSRNNAENANYFFETYARPLFIRNEQAIDDLGQHMMSQLDRAGKTVMVKMNSAIAPYAKKLEAASRKCHRQLDRGRSGERRGRWHR